MALIFPEYGSGHLPRLPLHRNDGLELVLVEAGELHWQVEGRAETVQAGSIFFTFPWETHGSVMEWEPGHRWSFVVLQLPGGHAPSPKRPAQWRWPRSLGFSAPEGQALTKTLMAAPRRSWPAGDEVPWLLPRLVAALRSGQSPGEIAALARLVLSAFGRIVGSPREESKSSPRGQLDRLCRTIAAAPGERWNLTRLQRASGFGRTRLDELFKYETGDSPAAFVQRARLVRARLLLGETDWSITRIAHECGFSSSQHFARVFRRLHGCSATSLRGRT